MRRKDLGSYDTIRNSGCCRMRLSDALLDAAKEADYVDFGLLEVSQVCSGNQLIEIFH